MCSIFLGAYVNSQGHVRTLAMQTHPDVTAAAEKPEATVRLQGIVNAYAVLRDARTRAHYDATGEAPS